MSSEYLITVPFTLIRDGFFLDKHLNDIVESTTLDNIDYDNYDFVNDPFYQVLDLQKSFLYVCTETVFNYPHAYITEKLYKGLLVKRPFITLGAPNTLSLLKDYGFKTFNQWWDESYDVEQSPSRRLEKVHAIIQDICSYSIADLQIMCQEMRPILEHNFNHYTTFGQNQLIDFDRECLKNLRR